MNDENKIGGSDMFIFAVIFAVVVTSGTLRFLISQK